MSSKYKPSELSPRFGASVFHIWEDRELRFDSPPVYVFICKEYLFTYRQLSFR